MIFDARDNRDALQQQLLQMTPTVVVLRANYPGPHKQNPYGSYVVLQAYYALSEKNDWTVRHLLYTAEGLVLLLGSSRSAMALKKETTDFEENHPLGRLVDCDVMHKGGEIRRDALQLPPRTCFLCGARAVLCVRNQTHARETIEDFFQSRVIAHIQQDASLINPLLFAMTCELSRPFSYGCVSFHGSGVHKDMDAWTFIDSTQALLKCIGQLPPQPLSFSELRAFGKRCETQLLAATQGINAQKGLLFLVLLLAEGMKHTTEFTALSNWIKDYSQPLEDDFQHASTIHLKTSGALGVRGHALNGYSMLFQEALPLFQKSGNIDTLTRFWITHTDDTTALRRVGKSHWKTIQRQAQEGVASEILHQSMVDAGCSTGGVADLTTCTLLIAALRKEKGNAHTEKSSLRDIKFQ